MQLTLEDVTVRRRMRDVLKGVSWTLPDRGRTLLLGRNGAGKTTTMRVVAGTQRPSSGRVALDGAGAARRTLTEKVSLMPQDITALGGLDVLAQISFAAWLGGATQADARRRARTAVELADLTDLVDRSPGTLSGGELRRVGLAEALARPADLLLLDEPTAGLDPAQRARVRDVILRIDRPVVVSTHQLDDVDVLFDSVVVIDRGRLVFHGSTDDLLDRGEGETPSRRAESAFLSLTSGA